MRTTTLLLLVFFTASLLTACYGQGRSNRPGSSSNQSTNNQDNQDNQDNQNDEDLPTVIDLTGPPEFTDEVEATFTFDCSQEDCTFQCDLNDTGFETCEPGVTYFDLEEGEQVFTVRALDAAGRQGPESTWEWTVDTVSPLVLGLDGPDDPTTSADATFTFWCSFFSCQFRCELTEASAGVISATRPCETGESYSGLADGDYTFRVYAVTPEAEGPASSWTWTIDSAAPQLLDLMGPASPTLETSATFTWGCDRDDCTYECTLTGTAQGALFSNDPCESGLQINDLADDTYELSVEPINSLGTRGTPEAHQWTLDTSTPQIHLVPLEIVENIATFSIACDDNGCEMECALGTGSSTPSDFTPCSGSTYELQGLSPGTYTLALRGTLPTGATAVETHTWDASLTEWSTVASNFFATCSIRTDGTLWCWGRNTAGQAGLGPDEDGPLSPMQVGQASNWAHITGGYDYSCATRTDGTLWCWGVNTYGYLGQGDTDTRWNPTRVGTATTWTHVDAGYSHVCGIRDGGQLWCWGYGLTWRLGTGNNNDQHLPVRIGTQGDWTDVSAGFNHTCGIRSGELYCWGSGTLGQIGDGGDSTRTQPTRVGTATDWTSVRAGNGSTCGLRGNGTLWCWGFNGEGQLGLGNFVNRSTPHQVGSLSSWEKITAQDRHVCAIRADGTLWCWGSHTNGRLGIGFTSTNQNTPQQVGDDQDWAFTSVNTSSCGVRDDHSLWCWGFNSAGQLGLGDTNDRTTPHRVLMYD